MRQSIIICFLIQTLLTVNLFGQETKVNLVIQWNDKLVRQEISNARLYIETDKETYNLGVSYYTGDLILSTDITTILTRDSIKSMTLTFDLNSNKGDTNDNLIVKTAFSRFLMGQPYLILNVYDLRVKKYKRQFGHLTKDNFLCEFEFPNSGRFIKM